MRSRALLITAAVLASLAAAAPASAAVRHGPAAEPRTTTIRAACAGGGRIAVTVDQPGDGSASVSATASNLPLDSVWDGTIVVVSTAGGGSGGFDSKEPEPDGTISTETVVPMASTPTVRVNFHSQDGKFVCIVRTQPERQWARTSCSLTSRMLSVTAVQKGADLDLTSRLGPVPAKSAWNTSASVRSPHASEGAAQAAHASTAGFVRSAFSFGYAINRTVTVSFANPAGSGCSLTLGTHRLPPL